MQDSSDIKESNEHSKHDDQTIPPPLTKRQLRKLIKREKWEKALPEKRAKEKLKMKQKRHSARINNEVLGPSRKMLKANKMATSECTLRVVLDMSFDDLMIEKDIAKCTKQLLRCYSFNRRAENPVQFYVTSFEGKIRNEMKKQTGYEHWDVYLREDHYGSVFEAHELVYLSSESDNVISELDHSKVYVIGGLVDHNSHKGLCHRLAQERGIAHARLPIGEFLEMSSRKVLAINHVFEIIVAVSQGSTWQGAMVATLPQRKGAIVKAGTASEMGDESGTTKRMNEETDAGMDETKRIPAFARTEDAVSEENRRTGIGESGDVVVATAAVTELDERSESEVKGAECGSVGGNEELTNDRGKTSQVDESKLHTS